MADSMDFSKQQLTPTGTDKVLVVRTDTEYGHETLTDIVKEMVTDPITDPIATRVTAIEDAIGSEETGSESGILKRVKANEANISTNTDNIATNASDISALQTGLANTDTEVAKKAPQETTYTKAEVDSKETTLENEIALKLNTSALIDLIYPIGSIYMSVTQTSPASFLGGTWTALEEGKALWTTTTASTGGATIDAGLPNITGSFKTNIYGAGYQGAFFDVSGAFSNGTSSIYYSGSLGGPATYSGIGSPMNFSAKTANSTTANIYKDDCTTVQPPAIRVYAWQRTA